MNLQSFNEFLNESKFNLKAIKLAKWYIKTQDRLSKEDIIDTLVNNDGYDRKDVEKWMDNHYDKINEKKGTTLFSPGDKDAVKGTGYGSKEKALDTIKIIDKLKKKDHMHAMAIATTMMNRAKHSENQSQGMRDAIPIFKKWIEDNRKT